MKIIPVDNILIKNNIFNNLIEYKDEQDTYSIFYHKNDKIYFELDKKNNILWCNYKLVWCIFSNQNTLEYIETQSVIKDMVDRYTNWGSVTPTTFKQRWNDVVDRYTNWGSVTPVSKYMRVMYGG